MKTVWHRLGRTDAINWIVITVVATLQFVGSFVISNADATGRELLLVGTVAISVLVVIAILLVTRYALIPVVPSKARPFFVVGMLQVAAFARAGVYDYLFVTFNFSDEGMFLSRLYASQFNIFVAGIVVSSLVSMARDFSENNEKLGQTLGELRVAQDQIETRLKDRRTALLASIRSQLETALTSVKGTNVSADAQHLKSLIDDVVRPISHRLGRDFTVAEATPVPVIAIRIRWSSVLRHALNTNPIHPVWLTIWTGFLSLQVISTAAGDDFVVPYVSAIGVFAVWFTTARFVWKQSALRLSVFPRAVIFSVLMLATPLVVNPLLEQGFGLDFFNTRVVVSAALYFFVMAWSLALVIAVADLLRKTNRELIDATSQLRRRVITDNVAARHFEQAVSHVLHGPIQDAIAASLKRVESLPSDAVSASSEGKIIRQHIDEALQLLDESPSRHYSVDQAISELSALWSGVVEIDCRCDETTANALNQAQTTSSIVIEVIREAISNAIRHGDASRINIDVALAEPESEVHISITNNGSPLPKQLNPGIGTQLLRDMTLSWSRRNLAEHVVLTAVVPLHAI